MTDGIVVAVTLEGTAIAPSILGACGLTVGSHISRGATTLPEPTTYSTMFTSTCLITVGTIGAGGAGKGAGRSIMTITTLTLATHRVTCPAIVTFTLLFTVDTVSAPGASSATLAAPEPRRAEAFARDWVTQG